MTEIWIIGASKFAVDVAGFVETTLGPDFASRGFLWVEGEEMTTDPAVTRPFDAATLGSSKLVVAVSDPRVRGKLFDQHYEILRRAALNVIHPSSLVAPGCQMGAGNVIGPQCYIGSNCRLGDFNVLNYQVGFGHHSQLGNSNFLAPGFQCGNTVNIGSGNFFGLSCNVGPGITIGDNNRFQAGVTVIQPIASNLLCFSSERLKAVQQPQEV